LPKAADEYYRLLAARVEVHATDSADHAIVTRESDGVVDVRLEAAGQTFFARRFDAHETSEILIYLHGGDDTAVVTGHVQQSIALRIIGGNGTNTFIDSSTVAGQRHATRWYDAGTVAGISYAPDTLFDRRPWEAQSGELTPPGADFGTKYTPFVGFSDHRGVGITPRFGVAKYTYGFGDRPYESMVKLEGEYAAAFRGARVTASADRRLEASPVHFMAWPECRIWKSSTSTASETRPRTPAARIHTSRCINGSGCSIPRLQSRSDRDGHFAGARHPAFGQRQRAQPYLSRLAHTGSALSPRPASNSVRDTSGRRRPAAKSTRITEY
jgi:hypothetical protein